MRVDELLSIVAHLASDQMRGRATGSPEQIAASNFVAENFAAIGLEPLGDVQDGRRTWLQWFAIEQLSTSPTSGLVIDATPVERQFAVMTMVPLAAKMSGTVQFCGLGRTYGANPDVPAGTDLTGRIAVAVVPAKGEVAPSLPADERFAQSFQIYRQLEQVAKGLAYKGAAAVVFVQLQDPTGLQDCLSSILPTSVQPRTTLPIPKPRYSASPTSGLGRPPVIVMSLQASRTVFAALRLPVDGTGDLPDVIPAGSTGIPARLDLAVSSEGEARACNVVGVLRGADPKLAKEAVMLTAHIDHIGCRMDGVPYNGANDNASGVAGLVGVARALAAGPRLRRSILFLVTSGEELGLWGARYFVGHPSWPVEGIVANINLEMIGRAGAGREGKFLTTPSFRHANFSTLGEDAAQAAAGLGISLLPGDERYQQGDHFPFAENGTPALSIGDEDFPEYHREGDDPAKIDGQRMRCAVKLAAAVCARAANADARPTTVPTRANW